MDFLPRRHEDFFLFLIWTEYRSRENITPFERDRLDPILDLSDETCSGMNSRRIRRVGAAVVGWKGGIYAREWLDAADGPVRQPHGCNPKLFLTKY